MVTLPILGFVALSGQLLLLFATVLAVFLGALDIEHDSWLRRIHGAALPTLLTVGCFLVSRVLPGDLPEWLPLAVLAALLPAAFVVERAPHTSGWAIAASRPLVVYATALLLFVGIYGTRLRALLASPAMGMAAALLALSLWRNGPRLYDIASLSRFSLVAKAAMGEAGRQGILLPSLVVGLVLAQVAWPLLYWPVPALLGGLVLLAVFYAAAGLMAAAVHGTMHRGMAAEYALVGLASLAIIVAAVLRAP